MDVANDDKVTVMRFNGAIWEVVGSAGFSAGSVVYLQLVLNSSDTPYVAYQDGGNGFKATVMRFNGSDWEALGGAGFSTGGATYTSLAIDNNDIPYVAYRDGGNGSRATVMRFDGTSWNAVGSPGFSAGGAEYISLALDSYGMPHLAYQDLANDNRATVAEYGRRSLDLNNIVTSNLINVSGRGVNIVDGQAIAKGDLAENEAYDYPMGLVDFNYETFAANNPIEVTFVTELGAGDVVAHKYNPDTEEYSEIPGAVITETTLNGEPALKVTYTIADNGPVDTDPTPGMVADPVGLALPASSDDTSGPADPANSTGSGDSLANTGQNTALVAGAAVLLIGGSLLAVLRKGIVLAGKK
jgi:hypothetical protein